jgi:hypothetical protein
MTTTASASASEAGQLAPPVQELEVKALASWEGLKHQIEEAKQESKGKTFDYNNLEELKAARSWLHKLRGLNGQIEDAREDAKKFYLEGGRKVDRTAKDLKSSVAALIQPHKDAIEEIEAREAKRVADHRSVLTYIEGLTAGITTSAEALARLEALEEVDTSTLEEFATAGANRAAEQSERLQQLYAQLLRAEADAAELEALRQEKARREAEEAAEALRLEGERRAAARLAAQQEEARLAAEQEEARLAAEQEEARLAAEQQEQAVLDCQPKTGEDGTPEQEEALQQGVPAEGDYRDHSAILQRRSVYQPPVRSQALEDPGAIRARHQLVLLACLKGKTGTQVAAELLDGTFHPAISVDTSLL